MGKTLLIAEKPSVARDIARVMRVTGKGEGCLVSDTLIVTWAIGHLVRLAEPDELNLEDRHWSMERLPILPESWSLQPIAKTRSQLTVLKKLMRSREVESLICATDAGREGELIFRWIYELSGCRKPVRRLWVNSMTDEAIREGMATLQPDGAYEALYQSALCRAKADWLIGMNLSRAFTVKHHALLSIGRVQTPTLALLVARQHEIEAFSPQTTFTTEADFGCYSATYIAAEGDGDGTALSSRAEAEAIAQRIKGKTGVIRSCERSMQREAPPQLFDLTTLQREANRRYGYTAQKTLSIAQALYEKHKLITYPRTDCRLLPLDVKPKVKQALQKLPEPYAALAPTALQGLDTATRVFRKEIDSDHHAIIPTGKTASHLEPDEQRLMDMILRRLLAAFYPPYEARKQEVLTDVEGLLFRGVQKETAQMGWKQVEGKQEQLSPLPELHAGERDPVQKATVVEHVSKPPQPYTDASILYAMEHPGKQVEEEALREILKKHGLGTPATRAAILERLLEVGYAKRKGKALLPTEKGCKLIACVPAALASAELTGKWEYGLNLIAEQKEADAAFAQRFMEGVERMTRELVEDVKTTSSDVVFEEEKPKRARARKQTTLDATCPLCGQGKVTENDKAFGCSRWKQGCTLTIWKDALARHGGPTLNCVIVERLLRDGCVRGSTGTVTLSGGQLRFSFVGSAEATPPIAIQGAARSAAPRRGRKPSSR